MKVKVGLKVKHSIITNETIVAAYYKTDKGIFSENVRIASYCDFMPVTKSTFLGQMEELLAGGHIKEKIKEMVIDDIVKRNLWKCNSKKFKDREEKILDKLKDIKFDFEFDDDKLNN